MGSKKILVAPLNWGLGHASRCVPLIRCLLERDCEVIIGASGRSLALLRNEFPALEFIDWPDYDITYPHKGAMAVKMAFSAPKIFSGIRHENKRLKKIIYEKKINAVISDNRFGLWNKDVPCVFITHQLMIKSPAGEKLLHRLNKSYILNYSECWIPDYEGDENFSGDLAHKFPLPDNAKFIGPLSRFSLSNGTNQPMSENSTAILVLLSGPEPQRSIFEKIIIPQLEKKPAKAVIIRGITEKKKRKKICAHVELVTCLGAAELESEILNADIIVCRPGYSTIMDLAVLMKKNMVFVPTPGQTEQEYLAWLLMKKNVAYTMPQKKFCLETALEESKKFKGFTTPVKNYLYKEAVEGLLQKL